MTINYKFTEFIPEIVEDNTIYISIEFCTAIHKCICGCGKEVVTPLSPTDWQLSFDGKSISLNPSIGNWSFECKSHYWIKKNQIVQCFKWDESKINKVRKKEKVKTKNYFKKLLNLKNGKNTKK